MKLIQTLKLLPTRRTEDAWPLRQAK